MRKYKTLTDMTWVRLVEATTQTARSQSNKSALVFSNGMRSHGSTFFASSGNLMGFPVGQDDDGTGDLKPPDMYGNN